MSAIESFRGASAPVMPPVLGTMVAQELTSMLDMEYHQLRYFPEFIQSQVAEKVMEQVERKFADEIRSSHVGDDVRVVVRRLFEDEVPKLRGYTAQKPDLSCKEKQAIQSLCGRSIENAAFDCALAGVAMNHAAVVDAVYEQFKTSDLESRWATVKYYLYRSAVRVGYHADRAIESRRSDDFVALRYYIRHHMEVLLQGVTGMPLEVIYDRVSLQWPLEAAHKPSVLRIIADQLICYWADYTNVADATFAFDAPPTPPAGQELRLPVLPDADEEREFCLAHTPALVPKVVAAMDVSPRTSMFPANFDDPDSDEEHAFALAHPPRPVFMATSAMDICSSPSETGEVLEVAGFSFRVVDFESDKDSVFEMDNDSIMDIDDASDADSDLSDKERDAPSIPYGLRIQLEERLSQVIPNLVPQGIEPEPALIVSAGNVLFEELAEEFGAVRKYRAQIKALIREAVCDYAAADPDQTPGLPQAAVSSDAASVPAHDPSAPLPDDLIYEMQDALGDILTNFLLEQDLHDLELDAVAEVLFLELQSEVPDIGKFPEDAKSFVIDAFQERVQSFFDEDMPLETDDDLYVYNSDTEDDFDDEDDQDESYLPPSPAPAAKRARLERSSAFLPSDDQENSSGSRDGALVNTRVSSIGSRKRKITTLEDVDDVQEVESPFSAAQRLDHLAAKPSIRIWMTVLEGCVTSKTGSGARKRYIEYLGRGHDFHSTFPRLESESLCQSFIDAGKIGLDDLKALCKPSGSIKYNGPGHYMGLITDQDVQSWYTKYIGQAHEVHKRVHKSHNASARRAEKVLREATAASLRNGVKIHKSLGALIYRVWAAKGTNRSANWMLLSKVVEQVGETAEDLLAWLSLVEMFFCLAFQTIQKVDLNKWLPSEIPREEPHVGLNVAIPLSTLGLFHVNPLTPNTLQSLDDPEIRKAMLEKFKTQYPLRRGDQTRLAEPVRIYCATCKGGERLNYLARCHTESKLYVAGEEKCKGTCKPAGVRRMFIPVGTTSDDYLQWNLWKCRIFYTKVAKAIAKTRLRNGEEPPQASPAGALDCLKPSVPMYEGDDKPKTILGKWKIPMPKR
ncbi:hypothetical protein QIS74_07222 [Colletotrichum tabaci]|uniref:Uncharacterized protein n=1 Tax=Colletotrichum tabaci TaxID=1209068 RepID=A0AAV9TAT4_9PEZI